MSKEKTVYNLIMVRYRNNKEGFVDEVTLGELILGRKIKAFYRPSEGRWVDVESDAVRRGGSAYRGPERRENRPQEASTPNHGFFLKLIGHPSPEKLTAREWFDRGFTLLFNYNDYLGAIRAFACCIELDPSCARAYLNRAMAYERIGNIQQSIEDYGRAAGLVINDAKTHYVRGLAQWHLGKDREAIEDLKRAAGFDPGLSRDLLKHDANRGVRKGSLRS